MTTPVSASHTVSYTPPVGDGSAVQAPGKRLVSLDVFRGMTMVLMILVNNPGTWAAVYWPLLHAEWHGWTPTDLVFPFFLFIVGVAIVFAFTKRLEQGVDRGDLVKKTLRRALVLFALGLVLSAFPFFRLEPEFGLRESLVNIRIMGVLQRIALCYAGASLLYLYAGANARKWVMGGILLGYWALMALVPVPGYGAGMLGDPVGNLASYLDRLLLPGHLWAGADNLRDPEGLLSTFPALVTTLLGVWTGRLLIDDQYDAGNKTARLMVAGALFTIGGMVWGWFFPVNKALWTSSYVLLTAGQAMLVLGVCYWFIDVKGRRKWTTPLVTYGVNAITVFFMSGIVGRLLGLIRVGAGDGVSISLQQWIFSNIFSPLGPDEFASLLYAVAWVLGWYLVLRWMYRRKIFIKV